MEDAKKEVDSLIQNPVVGGNVGIIRLFMERERESLYCSGVLTGSEEAADFIRPVFAKADRELLVIVSLSNSMEPLAVEVVAVGGTDQCVLDIRSVFKHALLNNATSIICFHNHTSGRLNPSRADIMMTSKLWEAGKVMDIRLVDHVIVSEKEYYSFLENDMLGEWHRCMKKYQQQESAMKHG